ncbi:tetratricopeptide repeat protein [Ostertagia ostertagi]
MHRWGFIPVFLLCLLLLHSQETGAPAGYKTYYQTAEQYYRLADATEVTDSLALQAYRRSILLLQKAQIVNDILIDSYTKCGILLMSAGNNAQALQAFQSAIAAFPAKQHLPDSLLFKSYLYAGSIHYLQNDLDTAISYYKKAEAVVRQYPSVSESERLYNKLGALYYETGDYRRSIPYYGKALSKVMEKKPADTNFIVNYKNNIASSLLKLGLYAQALESYKELLQYHRNEEGLYSNIGIAFLQQGDPKMALQYFRQVKQMSVVKFNNVTRIFLALQQYDSAAWYNQRSLDMLQQSSQNSRAVDWGLALKNKGDISCMAGNARSGLQYYQAAIVRLVPGFTDSSTSSNPQVFSGLQNFSYVFDLLTAKGKAFTQLSAQATGMQQHALAAYNAALALSRYVERTYSSDDARLFLKNKVNPACGEAVAVALALYENSKDTAFLTAAFGYVENNKASVLQAGEQQLELSGIAGLPAALMEEEKKYKYLIARLSIQLSQVQDSTQVQVLQKKMRDTELLLSSTQDKLDENAAYHRLKFNAKELSLGEIKEQSAAIQQAVLSYYYTGKQLICFYITPAETGVSSVPLTDSFFTAISGLRAALETPASADRASVNVFTQQLFRELVQPVAEKIKGNKHLVIIPYNEISYLPFELLRDEKTASLLLHQFAISYHYSANFLFDEPASVQQAYNVLAMAPFTEGETSSDILPALPSSGAEIAQLPGKQLMGAAATRAQFIALASQYPVIHLATHAVANDADPTGSYIEFYGKKADADTAHRLYEKEIYNLNMKSAGLVILSACETGNGQLVNGEGVVSLSRAFSYAGCKSVITSLWKADDAATAFIMKQLHAYLQQGFHKDIALQKAKIDYLNSSATEDRYKGPSYWAHLVLIGNHDAIVSTGKRWYIALMIGALLLAAGVFIYLKRTRVQ